MNRSANLNGYPKAASILSPIDRDGRKNPDRERKGKVEALHPMEAEFAYPQWVFGQAGYGFWGDDQIVAVYSERDMITWALLP